jgi:ABC-type glycerol-3-phosphate transport system substrate-binding protein
MLSIVSLLAIACNPTPPTATAPATGPTSAAPGKPAASAYLAPLPADKQVTIKFENYNLASAGLGRDATLEMIASFEAAHPNVKVETKATGSEEMFPSIQAQMVAGDPPDIAQLVLREWDLNVELLQPKDGREAAHQPDLQLWLLRRWG